MNEPKQKSLLALYKLLWEQIKDETDLSEGLCHFAICMFRRECIITSLEADILCDDIQTKMPKRKMNTQHFKGYTSAYGWEEEDNEGRKGFVQRMIKELTDKE